MPRLDRRHFLKAAASMAALPATLREALAIPADRRTCTIKDVGHVVILMQENRSFDHYFGCLPGVRGFSDPRPLILPSGKSVFHQPVGGGTADVVLPFRFDAASTRAERIASLDHSWKAQWNLWKNHDAWVPVKTPLTMGYFTRADIPFYYALADAFTVCDAYHASVFGPTNPNRLFLFSGTSGLAVKHAGPQAVENVDDGNWSSDAAADHPDFAPFPWTTYPERLEKAGVSWKIYQERDNFGDNPLSCFAPFRGDQDNDLCRRGRSFVEGPAEHSFGQTLVAAFAADVAGDRLPEVSWIVAPTAASEHPEAPPSIGEAFTAGILTALASNPAVWARTAFILTYDENDGFFDHAPPPVPATRPKFGASTVATDGEEYDQVPFGLGPRVPALIVSPWSKGGWVNSEVFDHTSVIRFLEARFGVAEPNITPWRRAVAGDLTSAFDFKTPDDRPVMVPGVSGLVERMMASAALADPAVPAAQSLPRQEPGRRPARPLPYRLAMTDKVADAVELAFENSGTTGACFHVVSAGVLQPGPWTFTVEAGKSLTGTVPRSERYDLAVHGPNGFFRQLQGAGASPLRVEAKADGRGGLVLALINDGDAACDIEIADAYAGDTRRLAVPAKGRAEDRRAIEARGHWYDFTVTAAAHPGWSRRLAGHIETGRPSVSDPMLPLA
jgi:phospholipase C